MNLVIVEKSEKIAYITINRPEKCNALNPEIVKLLSDAFNSLKEDKDVKVIVLKANGNVFSSGIDFEYLKKLQYSTDVENFTDVYALKELFLTIYRSPKVVIAQVEGHAIALGCGLASVCDIVFSVPEAKFAFNYVKIGCVPALITCFLVRKLGEGRLRELLLSGDLIDASKAFHFGLINFIEEKKDISKAVDTYAKKIATGTSLNSIQVTKQLLNSVHDLPIDEALNLAIGINVQIRTSADWKRGVSAFPDKNSLEW